MYVSISVFSIMFPWPICLPLSQYHVACITETLSWVLKSGSKLLQHLFFYYCFPILNSFISIWVLEWAANFYKNPTGILILIASLPLRGWWRFFIFIVPSLISPWGEEEECTLLMDGEGPQNDLQWPCMGRRSWHHPVVIKSLPYKVGVVLI